MPLCAWGLLPRGSKSVKATLRELAGVKVAFTDLGLAGGAAPGGCMARWS